MVEDDPTAYKNMIADSCTHAKPRGFFVSGGSARCCSQKEKHTLKHIFVLNKRSTDSSTSLFSNGQAQASVCCGLVLWCWLHLDLSEEEGQEAVAGCGEGGGRPPRAPAAAPDTLALCPSPPGTCYFPATCLITLLQCIPSPRGSPYIAIFPLITLLQCVPSPPGSSHFPRYFLVTLLLCIFSPPGSFYPPAFSLITLLLCTPAHARTGGDGAKAWA